ncbi:MAG TPA: hypothetical protein ENK18_15875 [Deltaproteobacteria bacterium]|nr:hypothetical protein [Deltaproteobacteria bacterium]
MWATSLVDGSVGLALSAAMAFLGGLLLEGRVLLRWRSDLYFQVALPLGASLVPIPRPPEGSGRTPSVRWEVSRPGLVRFWADPDERRAPSGLHGVVRLTHSTRGVQLELWWAPPWSPLLAAVWLGGGGLLRGEAQITLPIGLLILGSILIVYGDRARRVAQELRLSFVGGGKAPPEGL